MGDDVERWRGELTARRDERLSELFDLLRIPSVSALPEHQPDIERAATWVAARLRQAGVPEVEVLTSAGKPLVWGRWRVGDDRPTVLIYAHYDVQPPDPLELWETPPFEPTVRDGRVYARGAADDKAGLLLTIHAVEALARTHGAPPVNVVFFFEGEEEIGSPTLPALVRAERERLACDVVVSSDGWQFAPETPTVVLSTKGIALCELHLRTANTDLHSGEYGMSVPNAVEAMARLVTGLHTPEGKVAVEGFYDRVREPTAEERAEIAAVPFDEEEYRRRFGLSALWGEPGYSALERNWLRPSLDLNGLWGGFTGAGSKTVTPCEAHAKITCRLVPDQEPGEIVDLIERHVQRHAPAGATVRVTRSGNGARPFAIRRDHPALLAAAGVLREIYGTEPVRTRVGGTLPIAEVFQEALGADMVFFAWSLPESPVHAPNEWFRLVDFDRGAEAYAAYLTRLAGWRP